MVITKAILAGLVGQDERLTTPRLSLSNNQLFHIPYRFAECSHLRYLNIRSNNFREFPKGVSVVWVVVIRRYPADQRFRCINCRFLKFWTSVETKLAIYRKK